MRGKLEAERPQNNAPWQLRKGQTLNKPILMEFEAMYTSRRYHGATCPGEHLQKQTPKCQISYRSRGEKLKTGHSVIKGSLKEAVRTTGIDLLLLPEHSLWDFQGFWLVCFHSML